MGNDAKCKWCREQAGCHVVSVCVRGPDGSEHGAGFITCEACQQDFSRYVGQVGKSLPAINDDDPREWFLIEVAEDKCESDRRVYVNDVDNGRVTGPVNDVRFGMGRRWSYRILSTRRTGATDALWETAILRNHCGHLEVLSYDDGARLPTMDGKALSVFEALDLSL